MGAKAKATAKGVDPERPGIGRRAVFALIAIEALTVAAYLPALGASFTNWDDPRYVIENPLVRDLSLEWIGRILATPVMGNYHPLTMASLALDHHLSTALGLGGGAGVFHATSLLLHLLNTLLVFLLVRALCKGRSLAALVCAAFFALHPMHVESVAWISSRKDVLYTAFFLLSLLAYVRYLRAPSRRAYSTCLALYLLSLLSKPSAIPLPAVLLLLDFWEGRRGLRRILVEKIPFFGLALFFAALTYHLQQVMGAFPELDFSLPQRFLLGCYGFLAYIGKLFVPAGLCAFHPYPSAAAPLAPRYWIAPFLAAALLAAALLAARKTRVPAFGMLFYLVTIALVLQIVSIGHVLLAERYTYVPYVGLLFVLGHGVEALRGRAAGRAARGIVLLLVLACALATYGRARVWTDSGTLWSDVIRRHPGVALAYTNRASFHKRRGEAEEARKDYQKVIELEPERPNGYYNMGVFLQDGKKYSEAIRYYDEAIDRGANDFNTLHNRGLAHLEAGHPHRALEDLERARAIRPDHPMIHVSLGSAHLDLQEIDRAIREFDEAVRLAPGFYLAYLDRGVAHYRKGDLRAALEDYNRALSLRPGHASAYLKRSVVHQALGDRASALRDALAARRLGAAVDEAYLERLRRP